MVSLLFVASARDRHWLCRPNFAQITGQEVISQGFKQRQLAFHGSFLFSRVHFHANASHFQQRQIPQKLQSWLVSIQTQGREELWCILCYCLRLYGSTFAGKMMDMRKIDLLLYAIVAEATKKGRCPVRMELIRPPCPMSPEEKTTIYVRGMAQNKSR